MLKRLRLQQVTVFKDAVFDFGPGLNVLIGDNGTGKTHALKLGYLFCRAWPDLMINRHTLAEQRAEVYLDERLTGLFRINDPGDLIRLGQKGAARLEADVLGHIPNMHIRMASELSSVSAGQSEALPWQLQIKRDKSGAVARVSALTLPIRAAANTVLPRPIYVPSKEIVSLFKGLVGLFENYRGFPLDLTYRDLAVSMSTLEVRQLNPVLPGVAQRIRELLGGDLKQDDGDLVFSRTDGTRLESQLMAEGHRKLALLIYMLRTGLLEVGITLFWDEPEANLNPAAIRLLAEALYVVAGRGVQVILATHSLFLLREFEILHLAEKSADSPPVRYFGLGASKSGVKVTQGDDVAAVDPLVLLDESLDQSARYNEVAS